MPTPIFDDCEIWPVFLRFPDVAGYTLWGNGGDVDDLVLARDNHPLLFPDPVALAAFVAQDQDSNLALLPGYEDLRKAAATLPGKVWKSSAVAYRFDLALEAVNEAPDGWDMGTVATVGDVLSMLTDLACTQADEEVVALLDPAYPLGHLSGALAMVSRANLQVVLQAVDWPQVSADLERVVTRLRGACQIPA